MYDYQQRQPNDNLNDSGDYYQIENQDRDRPRPMTTAEYQGEGRRNENRYGGTQQNFGGVDKFPTIDTNSNTNNRAYSAKPYKGNTTMQSPNARRANEKPGVGGLRNVTYTLQNNKLAPSPSGDFSRKMPKNIMQDKERLYEETLHLKSIINTLKEDNLKLKTKISNLEKEATKFEKMIQESNTNFYRGETPVPKNTETHLTMTLKQNVKELRSNLKSRDEELAEIKKTLKYTKVQEIEAQMKAYQDEALRLRTIMDHVMKEKAHIVLSDDDKNRLQEEYFVQATQLKTLKRDNEEMATAIKILEEQNFEYEKKITEQEKKYRRDHNQHKKALQEKEKELTKLRNDPMGGGAGYQGNSKRPMTTTGTRDDAFRQELEKKTLENNNLINQLAEKRNQILSLERQLRDLKTEYSEKITGAQNEKQALLREIEKLKNAKALGPEDPSRGHSDLKVQELKLDDYVRRASLQRNNFSQDEKDKIMMYGQNSGTNAQNEKAKGVPKKRVQKVRPDDVKDIGYELNLRLRIKKMTFEDIEKVIWPEKIRKAGVVTIKEMIDILKGDPFSMTNDEQAVLTARYLIEDNENEFLYYDETVKNDLHIVKSILKKMIGYLPPWDEAKVRRIHQEVSDICIQNYGGLRENLKALCKHGFLKGDDLREACNLIDVTLADDQVEYIITKLFEHSDDIHKLSIDRLFEIFSSKPKEIAEDQASRPSESRNQIQIEPTPTQSRPSARGEQQVRAPTPEVHRAEDDAHEESDDQRWREEEKGEDSKEFREEAEENDDELEEEEEEGEEEEDDEDRHELDDEDNEELEEEDEK